MYEIEFQTENIEINLFKNYLCKLHVDLYAVIRLFHLEAFKYHII